MRTLIPRLSPSTGTWGSLTRVLSLGGARTAVAALEGWCGRTAW
jgi:hypothetical protein